MTSLKYSVNFLWFVSRRLTCRDRGEIIMCYVHYVTTTRPTCYQRMQWYGCTSVMHLAGNKDDEANCSG